MGTHCSGKDPDKSRFHKDYRSPEALEQLIAHCLREAGEFERELVRGGPSASHGQGWGSLTDGYGLFKTRSASCPGSARSVPAGGRCPPAPSWW
jgi:hypothetical protein